MYKYGSKTSDVVHTTWKLIKCTPATFCLTNQWSSFGSVRPSALFLPERLQAAKTSVYKESINVNSVFAQGKVMDERVEKTCME
jgi:hypothetical protein